MKFIFLDHTADQKFQAFGSTKEEAFVNAALALKTLYTKDQVQGLKEKKVEVKGIDDKQLLYNWLEQFLILMDMDAFILAEVKEFKMDKNKISAKVSGDDCENYTLDQDIKAITYHDMKIDSGIKWKVQVVVDL